MSEPKEYITSWAILKCEHGLVPMPFRATPKLVKIGVLEVANEFDIAPFINLPTFVLCKKLTQQMLYPVPCIPVPTKWEKTDKVKLGGGRALVKQSCMTCGLGGGKMEFVTPGQVPLPTIVHLILQEFMEKFQKLKTAQDELQKKQANAVGEAGFWEGLIPIWGSGRDLIHAWQTGSIPGIILNTVFFYYDVASVIAGIASLGLATVAMMGAKAGLRVFLKTMVKLVVSSFKQEMKQIAQQGAKLLKELPELLKGAAKMAKSISKDSFAKLKNAVKSKVDDFLERIKKPKRTGCNTSESICKSDPVDVATGKVFTESIDFQLNGIIPLVWERIWYSTSDYAGNIGYGWHHAYDMQLICDHDAKIIALRLSDGRVAILPYLNEGETDFLKKEKIKFFRKGNQYGYTQNELDYWFTEATHPVTNVHVLERIQNKWGDTLTFNYDNQGVLKTIQDDTGRILRFTTDEHHRILNIQTQHPIENTIFNLVEYVYDEVGHLIKSRDMLGHTTQYQYEGHLLVCKTNANGLRFYFEYDGMDENAYCIKAWGDDDIYKVDFSYDLKNHCTTVVDSVGSGTQYYYNEMGLVIRQIHPDNSTFHWTYDEEGFLLGKIDEIGRLTRYVYDDFGNVILEKHPDEVVLQWVYEENRLLQHQDALGGKWQYQYNVAHQLVQSKDPLERLTRYEYDVNGLLQTIIDASGQKTTLEYDTYKNVTKVILPDQTCNQWKYDSFGNCIISTDVYGNQQFMEYDLSRQLISIKEADGNFTQMEYDGMGNLLRVRDVQQDVQLEYAGLNQLVARKENGTRIEFQYDTEERLIGIRNEQGYTYHFELDKRGQVTQEMGFDGLVHAYQRDAVGQVIEIKRGTVISNFEYDVMGQVTQIRHNDNRIEQFSYRPDGYLVTATNENGTILWERDAVGRVVREARGEYWINSIYDALDNRIEFASSMGAHMSIDRDSMGAINGLHAAQFQQTWQARFKRDKGGLELQRQLTGGIQSSWQRDYLGRPQVQWTQMGNRVHRHKQYSWGLNDRLKSIHDLANSSNGHTEFGHDAAGNLTWARYGLDKIQYRMPDAVGNLFKTENRQDRHYGSAGQLLADNGATFKYNAVGHLIQKIESNGDIWQYDWTAKGYLAQVVRPDGDLVSFTYDALGRRLSKKYRENTTHWLWDGDVPLHEWVENSKRPHSLITWLFEPESFEPIAKLTASECFSIIPDHLGTPTQLFDGNGKLVWAMELDSYGAIRTLHGSAMDCPFRYQGQYHDVETGLYYNRFRYYDSELGQYISQDPIRLKGNNATLYAYVKDPNRETDKFGLNSCPRRPIESDNNFERMGKQIGKAPRNNQVQLRQVNQLARKYKLSGDESERLHDYITHQGYSFKELEAIIKNKEFL